MRAKLAALVVALLVGGAGAAAATGGVATVGAANDSLADRPADVDVDGQLDDDTVTLVVTDAGTAYEGVNVSVDDEHVGTTDANGTVTFVVGNDSEIEVELSAPGFEGELEYTAANGSLLIQSEEYEYGSEDHDEADERESDGDSDDRDVPEEAADAPGHDGDLPDEASDNARANVGGDGADRGDDEESEHEENDEDEQEDDEDEQEDDEDEQEDDD